MKNKKISIAMNERRMKVIEDAFFITLNKKDYDKIKPTLLLIWKEICEEHGKTKREPWLIVRQRDKKIIDSYRSKRLGTVKVNELNKFTNERFELKKEEENELWIKIQKHSGKIREFI